MINLYKLDLLILAKKYSLEYCDLYIDPFAHKDVTLIKLIFRLRNTIEQTILIPSILGNLKDELVSIVSWKSNDSIELLRKSRNSHILYFLSNNP